jgi:hypothetical protein
MQETRRTHHDGGAANLHLCVDALNQNEVELGKRETRPEDIETQDAVMDAIFFFKGKKK